MLFDHFDQVRVINLKHRTDRRAQMLGELRRIGADNDPRVAFFGACRFEDAGTELDAQPPRDAGADKSFADHEERGDQHDAGVAEAGNRLVDRDRAGEGQQDDHDQRDRIHARAVDDEHRDRRNEQEQDDGEVGGHDRLLRSAGITRPPPARRAARP